MSSGAVPLPPAVDTTPLRTGALAFDLTGRGALEISGADRVAFLQGLVTNDVRPLRPGSGCPALFLTPKGKLRATLDVLALDDRLLLDTEPDLAGLLEGGLRSYIVYPPVDLVNVGSAYGIVHVEGPSAPSLVEAVVRTVPAADRSHGPFSGGGTEGRIVRVSRAGEPGFDLRVPPASVPLLLHRLDAAGCPTGPGLLLEAARIETGPPRWGAELDGTVLPDEAGLQITAVSYTKGCYVGQETVARLRTYGHVNRHLCRLSLPLETAAASGDAVLAAESNGSGRIAAGRVASAVRSIRLGRTIAFAWVKREFEEPGSVLEVATASGSVPARIA